MQNAQAFIIISRSFWHAFAEPQPSEESAIKSSGLGCQCLVLVWEL
jgi:hypothetical protein